MKRLLLVLLFMTFIFTMPYNVHASQTGYFENTSSKTPEEELTPQEMSLNLVAMDADDINGVPAVKIYIDFNWNIDPFWTLTDGIKFSWAQGWHVHDSYLEVTHLYNDGTEKTKSYKPDEQSSNSLLWNYDIQKAADVYGRAVITLVPDDLKAIKEITSSTGEVQYIHEAKTMTLKPVNFISTRSVSWKVADILD